MFLSHRFRITGHRWRGSREPMTEVVVDNSAKFAATASESLLRSHAKKKDAGVFRLKSRLSLGALAMASLASLGASLLLAGCQSVSGYSAVSLVRVIDASYNAPAINVFVEGNLVAANIGQGSIT